jgi:hypothetical protein
MPDTVVTLLAVVGFILAGIIVANLIEKSGWKIK